MKNVLKFWSLGIFVLFLSVFAFLSCKKQIVDTDAPTTNPSVILTADMLANDVYFQEYIQSFNTMQAGLPFLNKAKSQDERKSILNKINQLSLKLSQMGDGLPQYEQQKIVELLGFETSEEATAFCKDLAEKRTKLLNKFSVLKNGNYANTRTLLQNAYDFSERYWASMVVYTKENGIHSLNKRVFMNSLNTQTECVETGWAFSCNGNACEKNGIEGLKATFSAANATLLEQLTSYEAINLKHLAAFVYNYGSSLDFATQNFEHDVSQCH